MNFPIQKLGFWSRRLSRSCLRSGAEWMTSRETMELVDDGRTLMMTRKDTEGGMTREVGGVHSQRYHLVRV